MEVTMEGFDSSAFLDGFMGFFDNLKADLSADYIKSSTITSLIVGAIAAALIIFAAIMYKKSMAFGIVAGVLQIPGAVGVQKMVHYVLQMDFYRKEIFYGYSQEDVDQQINDFLYNYYKDAVIDIVMLILCSMLGLLAWIFALVVIIKAMKQPPKAFAIIALILHIIRYVVIAPYDLITPIVSRVTEASQKTTDMCYYIFTLIPLLLFAIGSIFVRVKMKKQAAEKAQQNAEPAATEEI